MSAECSLFPESTVSHTRKLRCSFQSVLKSQEFVNIDVILYTSGAWLPEVVQEECLPKLRDPCSQFCQREERLCVVHCPERNTFASGLQNGPACISLRQLEERLATVHGPERSTSSSGPKSDPDYLSTDVEGGSLDAHSTEPSPLVLFHSHELNFSHDSLLHLVPALVQAQKGEPTASLFPVCDFAKLNFNSEGTLEPMGSLTPLSLRHSLLSGLVQAQKGEPTVSPFQDCDFAKLNFNLPEGTLEPTGSLIPLSSRHSLLSDLVSSFVSHDLPSHTALASVWAQERKPTVFLSQARDCMQSDTSLLEATLEPMGLPVPYSSQLLLSLDALILKPTNDSLLQHQRMQWDRELMELCTQLPSSRNLRLKRYGGFLIRDPSLHKLLDDNFQIKHGAINALNTVDTEEKTTKCSLKTLGPQKSLRSPCRTLLP